jgi:hypothetical protein
VIPVAGVTLPCAGQPFITSSCYFLLSKSDEAALKPAIAAESREEVLCHGTIMTEAGNRRTKTPRGVQPGEHAAVGSFRKSALARLDRELAASFDYLSVDSLDRSRAPSRRAISTEMGGQTYQS